MKKILSIIILIIIVSNLALFAFRKISALIFWIVILIGAVMAYKVLPRIKTKGI